MGSSGLRQATPTYVSCTTRCLALQHRVRIHAFPKPTIRPAIADATRCLPFEHRAVLNTNHLRAQGVIFAGFPLFENTMKHASVFYMVPSPNPCHFSMVTSGNRLITARSSGAERASGPGARRAGVERHGERASRVHRPRVYTLHVVHTRSLVARAVCAVANSHNAERQQSISGSWRAL